MFAYVCYQFFVCTSLQCNKLYIMAFETQNQALLMLLH